MSDLDLQRRISEAMQNPKTRRAGRRGCVGTVGTDCGEMLRLWIKFRKRMARRSSIRHLPVLRIETAIAVASLATELIRGKTAEGAFDVE